MTVAAVALIVLSPLFLVIAGIVAVTSRGPAFYRSTRIGSTTPEFKAWKFRSMHVDADERLAELLGRCATSRQEYDTFRKLKQDPRITTVGNVLRRSSLDELPQLLNILMGQMSVVGPRPKLPNEREMYGDVLPLVLSVKPGLTGLWQISGRNNLTVEQRVHLDVRYVMTRSFRGDLGICLRTALQLLRPGGNGAF